LKTEENNPSSPNPLRDPINVFGRIVDRVDLELATKALAKEDPALGRAEPSSKEVAAK